jgi:hypothetical protein
MLFTIGCNDPGTQNHAYDIPDTTKAMNEGNYADYYENGSIKDKRFYYQGKKDGCWKTYDKDKNITTISFYKDDSLLLVTTDTRDYTFKAIKDTQLQTIFFLPEAWNRCPSENNLVLCLFKLDSGKYSPNLNLVIFPFQRGLSDLYVQKKMAKIKKDYNDSLIYDINNPYFPIKSNHILKYRLNQNSIELTFFTFIFEKDKYLVELNLSCDSKEELLYEDLAKEIFTSIQFVKEVQ